LGLATEPLFSGEKRVKATRRGSLGFGVFLLIVGVILLYNQFYPIDFSFLEDWWPLLLVVAGLWMLVAHFREKAGAAANSEVTGSGGSDI
jgi:uncharacterized membrane protein HdeD (DUF308 family)